MLELCGKVLAAGPASSPPCASEHTTRNLLSVDASLFEWLRNPLISGSFVGGVAAGLDDGGS